MGNLQDTYQQFQYHVSAKLARYEESLSMSLMEMFALTISCLGQTVHPACQLILHGHSCVLLPLVVGNLGITRTVQILITYKGSTGPILCTSCRTVAMVISLLKGSHKRGHEIEHSKESIHLSLQGASRD